MHKRNIKLNFFLRFIHHVMVGSRFSIPNLRVFRLVVNGKLKGGKHRTKVFTAGFGKAPLNSVGWDLRYCYDNLYSKYGEYGLHLLIGRRNALKK